MTSAQPYYAGVLARFAPVADMKPYAEKLQDRLRLNGYPEYDLQTVERVRFTVQHDASATSEVEQSTLWHFSDPQRRCGFILSTERFVFHTTRSLSHDELLERFHDGLSTLFEITGSTHVRELSVRVLHALRPEDRSPLERHLANGLHGLNLNRTPTQRLFESVFEGQASGNNTPSTLVVRVLRAKGAIGYPSDFRPQTLRHADIVVADIENRDAATSHLMFDISCSIQCDPPLDVQAVNSSLAPLHQEAHEALQAAVRLPSQEDT